MPSIVVADRPGYEGVFTEHYGGGFGGRWWLKALWDEEGAMLAIALAIVMGLGSVLWYGLAWVFPALSRRYDVILAGMGLFYGLVLGVCAGQVTGAIALGQLVVVALLGTLAWQVLQLRGGTAGEAVQGSQSLASGVNMLALVGGVRSRVTNLRTLKTLNLTGLFKKEGEVLQGDAGAIATPEPQAETPAPTAAPKPSETSEKEEPSTPETPATQPEKPEPKPTTTPTPAKQSPPKAATQPMPTGKGVYQRKRVRKFAKPGQAPAKKTGQPVYQRKRVRKFDDVDGKPKTSPPNKLNEPKKKTPPPTSVEQSTEQSTPQIAQTAPPEKKEKEASVESRVSEPVTVETVQINGDVWGMAVIAPETLLIPDNKTTTTLPLIDDPWITPVMDPEEFEFEGGVEKAEEMVVEKAVETLSETFKEETAPEPEEIAKPEPQRSPRQPTPAPIPEDSNWPDDDADSNWPDDGADSNWPDEQPARRKPKPRRQPRSPVVEAEVVERSPRRLTQLSDAELIQDDDPSAGSQPRT